MKNFKLGRRIVYYALAYSLITFTILLMIRPFIYSTQWLNALGNVILVISLIDLIICGITIIVLLNELLKSLLKTLD
jgi:hypothetical protein